MEEIGISEILANFHFIRPYWLMAFIPLILVLFLLRLQDRRTNAWEGVIDQNALNLYLKYSYVPSPKSIYKNVKKVSPGTYIKFIISESSVCEKLRTSSSIGSIKVNSFG